jgi:hypothetical protein
MPRKSRKQMVGKMDDVERAEREERLRALARELHLRGWLDRHVLDLEVVVFVHNEHDTTATDDTQLPIAS